MGRGDEEMGLGRWGRRWRWGEVMRRWGEVMRRWGEEMRRWGEVMRRWGEKMGQGD